MRMAQLGRGKVLLKVALSSTPVFMGQFRHQQVGLYSIRSRGGIEISVDIAKLDTREEMGGEDRRGNYAQSSSEPAQWNAR